MKSIITFKRSNIQTVYALAFFTIIFFLPKASFAQDEPEAQIQLIFNEEDSTRTCTAMVTAGDKPVEEAEVQFYVERMFSLLPIGRGEETDENGEAVQEFPYDLPGDKDGNLHIVAKIEDHDIYGTVEGSADVKWGAKIKSGHETWGHRSLSAARDKAPTILILTSNFIIAIIWGTILYVIFQVYRIKKARSH